MVWQGGRVGGTKPIKIPYLGMPPPLYVQWYITFSFSFRGLALVQTLHKCMAP